MEKDDWQLLDGYVLRGSEEAFCALVERHGALVYHAALRRTGRPDMAQEITQAVFIALAQKAGKLPRKTVLPGWLFRATHFAARNLSRRERRREQREQQAMTIHELLTPGEMESVWDQILPHLDEALNRLSPGDRDAILIRFFENRSHKEVARSLGVSEDAAKMRISRALEKMRVLIARQGVAVPAVAFAAVVTAHGAPAAPLSLTLLIRSASAAGQASSASAAVLARGTLKTMAWSGLKTAVLVSSVVLVATVATIVGATRNGKSGPPNRRLGVPVADRHTPRGTLLVMSEAMKAGDAERFVDCFVFTNAASLTLKTTFADLVIASAKFRGAIRDKFGAAAERQLRDNLPLVAPREIIVASIEQIKGETAELTVLGGKTGRPMELRWANGEWKFTPEGFLHLDSAVQADIFARLVKATDETTAEIPQGKYRNAMEALEATKKRTR